MIPFQSGQPLKASDLNYNFGQAQAGSFIPGAGSLGQFSGAGFTPAPVPHIPTTASSGASIVHFTITAFRCSDTDDHGHQYATAEVTFVACGLGDPDVGDEIDVYDLMGCWFTDSEPLLIGRKGIAFKVTHDPGIYGGECTWSVMALCSSAVNC